MHTEHFTSNFTRRRCLLGLTAGALTRMTATSPAATPQHISVRKGLVTILCSGTGAPGYSGLLTNPSTAGLFSQLNYLTQQVLEHTLAGRGPQSLDAIYATRLTGYGNAPLSEHFAPGFACPTARPAAPERAVRALREAPRYQVVTTLLHLLLRPRAPPSSTEEQRRYDLAVHVRRGDRITSSKRIERMAVWDEARLVGTMRSMLGAAPSPSVLLASDDNAFAAALARRLEVEHGAVRVTRLANDAETFSNDPRRNVSVEAALVCGGGCVAPLLALLRGFTRARQLLLSSRSNLGGFVLSSWGGANGGAARGQNGAVSGHHGLIRLRLKA